jgi:hypothetical protein
MLSIALFGLRACRFRVYFCRLSFAPPFLSYKMIARNLLGSTGRWGFWRNPKQFSTPFHFSNRMASRRPPQRQ